MIHRHLAVDEAIQRLSELLGHPPEPAAPLAAAGTHDATTRLRFPGREVSLLCRSTSDVAAVAGGVRALGRARADSLLVLAVPFMGDAGRRLCDESGVSWLDLSGNARILAPGLRIEIHGRPNLFRRVGRPGTAFAPKSARIARWLLTHVGQPATQQQIADATNMDRGFTSRIVRRLIEAELVERTPDGAILASRPALLLDAWAEQYDWSRHRVHRGVIAARSGPELTARLTEALTAAGVQHAFTGLAAAWQHDPFASYRLTTVFLPDGLSSSLSAHLGVRDGERGANVWLVAPDDPGVTHGARDVDGVRCVHPVQAWLDLASHPERASEARDHLRHLLEACDRPPAR